MTLANKITFLRLFILTPLFVVFYVNNLKLFSVIAFFLAALTDMLDGFVARHFKQKTELGKVMDPIADKALLLSAFVLFFNRDMIPLWLFSILIARDVLLVFGVILLFIMEKEVEIKPTYFGKITVMLQMLWITYLLLFDMGKFEIYMRAVVAAVTVVSSIDYMLKGYRMLSKIG